MQFKQNTKHKKSKKKWRKAWNHTWLFSYFKYNQEYRNYWGRRFKSLSYYSQYLLSWIKLVKIKTIFLNRL